jgi:hypothetical protein
MTIKSAFSTFCDAIVLDNLETMKTTVGEIAKKLNEKYYGVSGDTASHMYIVGSVGRNTAVKNASDLDIIFDLPNSVYKRFNDYESNGQSALLQEIKNVLKERYPRTTLRGDGQVVVIEFTSYTVELVPGFKQSDDRFKYPDTHDGGSWKYTDPLSEQGECAACDERSNKNYYHFCHIIRCLRNKAGFSMGGLLIDTLVYNHFTENDDYSSSGYSDYLEILKNLLYYLKGRSKETKYWLAVGSNQQVTNTDSGSWISKVQDAYDKIKDLDNASDEVFTVLHDLLGKEFPTEDATASYTRTFATASSTEQFIDQLYPVDIQYSLHIECKVTQDGWRPAFLRDMLRQRQWLSHNKKLDFYITSTNCPQPYSIYWKVRNVGSEAMRRGMIRGEIKKTDQTHQIERTSFYGEHFVECYLVKNGICVAFDRIDVPIAWH